MVALKGNTTSNTPNLVQDDNIEILPKIIDIHKDITLIFYIMYVNGMPFMIDINTTIN